MLISKKNRNTRPATSPTAMCLDEEQDKPHDTTRNMKKVAIQGFEGSYHDIATSLYFKDESTELVCCETFDEVFDTLASDNDAVALVAIENTIAGSLLHVTFNDYTRFRQSIDAVRPLTKELTILGEYKAFESNK